jgi:hypothetical protein
MQLTVGNAHVLRLQNAIHLKGRLSDIFLPQNEGQSHFLWDAKFST